jgi:hypothetical protein
MFLYNKNIFYRAPLMSARLSTLVLSFSLGLLLCASPLHAAEPTPDPCRYQPTGVLPIRYHGLALLPVVDGHIDGTPAKLLLNTGVADNLLTRFGTDKRQLPTHLQPGLMVGQDKKSQIHRAPIRTVDAGPIRVSEGIYYKLIDEMGFRPEYDALLGGNFLLNQDVELHLAEKQVKFYEPKDCKDSFLAYWDNNAVDVPLEMENRHKRPFIHVRVNGVTLRALISTAAPHSYIANHALWRLRLTLNSPGMRPLTNMLDPRADPSSRVLLYRFKSFTAGHETIQNPELPVKDGNHEMVLGLDFLRSHRVLLAPSQRKAYLSYLGGPPFATGQTQAEEWMVKEAEAGNADAQFRMMRLARSTDLVSPQGWLDKALAQGHPGALRLHAALLLAARQPAEALPLLEQAIANDPFDLEAQLELFRVRVAAKQPEAARTALGALLEQIRSERWPVEVAKHYLGQMTLEELLKEANSEPDFASVRRCDLYRHVGKLARAQGQTLNTEWEASVGKGCVQLRE